MLRGMPSVDETREWEVGEVAVLTVEFYDENDTLTDPTTVTARAKKPDGTVLSYTYAGAQVTKLGVGQYQREFPIDIGGGDWTFGMLATGAVATSKNVSVTVRKDPFA